MQLLAHIGIIAMQLAKIIGKIKTVVKPKINSRVYLCFRKTFGPSLYFIHHLLLRPL